MMRRLLALAALLVVAPVVAQEDAGVYFALTSNKTFASGDTAKIQMWAQNLKTLDFRLYRVEKAGEFLGQLGDAHSFGNQVKDLPKEDTMLAKYLRAKRRLREQGQLLLISSQAVRLRMLA